METLVIIEEANLQIPRQISEPLKIESADAVSSWAHSSVTLSAVPTTPTDSELRFNEGVSLRLDHGLFMADQYGPLYGHHTSVPVMLAYLGTTELVSRSVSLPDESYESNEVDAHVNVVRDVIRFSEKARARDEKAQCDWMTLAFLAGIGSTPDKLMGLYDASVWEDDQPKQKLSSSDPHMSFDSFALLAGQVLQSALSTVEVPQPLELRWRPLHEDALSTGLAYAEIEKEYSDAKLVAGKGGLMCHLSDLGGVDLSSCWATGQLHATCTILDSGATSGRVYFRTGVRFQCLIEGEGVYYVAGYSIQDKVSIELKGQSVSWVTVRFN